ncbi:MAG: transglycosylase SLT domain-containing protein [Methanogenium sp.]|jgi:soluble lytic murein transglycosylase-like protein
MKNIIQMGAIILLMGMIVFQNIHLSNQIYPIMCQQTLKNHLQQAVIKSGLGDPGKDVVNAVVVASKQTGLSEPFILALMHTESSFKKNAVSSKQYQGLMQIPQKIHYPDANCLIGSRIFLEKLEMANGDKRKAIGLYKGYGSYSDKRWTVSKEGYMRADKVLKIAYQIKENMDI